VYAYLGVVEMGSSSLDPKDIMDFLIKLSRGEPEPLSGMMFTHAYETGDPTLRVLARKAF